MLAAVVLATETLAPDSDSAYSDSVERRKEKGCSLGRVKGGGGDVVAVESPS